MKYDLSPLKIAFEKNADSDYAALASGTVFKGPDGVKRTKP